MLTPLVQKQIPEQAKNLGLTEKEVQKKELVKAIDIELFFSSKYVWLFFFCPSKLDTFWESVEVIFAHAKVQIFQNKLA